MLEVNYDYEAAIRHIEQLEQLNATLAKQIDQMRPIVTVAEVLADYGISTARYNDLQAVVDQYRDQMAREMK
jgi:hypothetical protein